MAEPKSSLNRKIDVETDPFDEHCYYLDSIKGSEKKMATSALSNMIEFTIVESNLFNVFTMYLKLTQKFVISTSLMAKVDHFSLTTHVLGSLTDEKVSNIKLFLNEKLKQTDEENEWEEFKVTSKEVCKAGNWPMINYLFYTKGGGGRENKATKRNVIHFFFLLFKLSFNKLY